MALNHSALAAAVRAHRARLGVPLRVAEKDARVSRYTINKVERDAASDLTYDTVAALCRWMGVEVTAFDEVESATDCEGVTA